MIFNCPQCGQAIEANDSIASQKVKCPTCLTDVTAPSPQEHYMAEPQVPPVADPSVHQDTPPLSAENTEKQIELNPRVQSNNSAAFILGIISIVFGSISIGLGLLPVIGAFLSIPSAIIGVIIGVIGFIFAATKKFQGAAIPVIGIMLSIFGLFSTSYINQTFAKKTSNILQQGLVSRAKMNIGTFQTAAINYKISAGDYPTTEQGLEALFTRPTNVRAWEGPYIRESYRDLLIDPWGNLYNYRWVKDETPDIFSSGPDSLKGTEDDIRYKLSD